VQIEIKIAQFRYKIVIILCHVVYATLRHKEESIMQSATSKVTSKGQIVIPKRFREKYNIGKSTCIKWIEKEEGLLMVPESDDPIVLARGMLRRGILGKYMQEKSKDKMRENKKNAGSDE
jgi:AbrB family looped-hinge helix DNA binding protein